MAKSKPKKARKPLSIPAINITVKGVAGTVAAVGVCVGLWLGFTSPWQEKAAEATQAREAAQAVLQANEQRIADITSGKKTAAQDLFNQGVDLDRKLPAVVDRVELVGNIPALAGDTVEVLRMDPQPTPEPIRGGGGDQPAAPPSAGRSETFAVAASGTPDSLTAWLRKLQDYPSTLTVSDVRFQLRPEEASKSQVSFTLTAHYVPSPELATLANGENDGDPEGDKDDAEDVEGAEGSDD